MQAITHNSMSEFDATVAAVETKFETSFVVPVVLVADIDAAVEEPATVEVTAEGESVALTDAVVDPASVVDSDPAAVVDSAAVEPATVGAGVVAGASVPKKNRVLVYAYLHPSSKLKEGLFIVFRSSFYKNFADRPTEVLSKLDQNAQYTPH